MTTLFSLLGVMALLFVLISFFPENGISIGALQLKFPTTKEFFALDVKKDSVSEEQKALVKLIDSTAILRKIDSTFNKQKQDSIYKFKLDSIIKFKLDSISKVGKSIQGNEKSFASLQLFFNALKNANNKKVRILHYGDSQIESDRITSYLRNQLQRKHGGSGVGLFPVIQVSQKWTLNNTYSKNWKRYTGFGKKNPNVKHRKYGALMSFCRFTPIPKDSILDEEQEIEGWIKIKKAKLSYRKIQKYAQVNIYLRNWNYKVTYEILADGNVVKTGSIDPKTTFKKIQATFATTPNELEIKFKGKESPDIFGISLEGNTGIVMDNIPLRGSSGTLFTRQDADLLKVMYKSLSLNMIILEFGGNTVPYIKYQKQIKDYGNWFKQQIHYLKRINPNAVILVIGPGDMSVKEKTEFITQPHLEAIRDAVKNAALSSDCLFWDMYEGMGGKNSMPLWVNAEPALGASDYIHFTPKGAVKISQIFIKELFKMYTAYESSGIQKKEVVNDSIR
jgi:lysophospholipase L1-like esterase